METYPYEYDRYNQPTVGRSRQQQNYEGRSFPANSNQPQAYAPTLTRQRVPQAGGSQKLNQQQSYAPTPTQQRVPQAGATQKPKGPKPMPKARALALVNTLKKSLVVASLAAFVSFGGLAAFHQVGATATKTASASTTSTSSTQTNSKNFLKQSGGNTSGTSSSSSSAVSGSSTS